MDVISATILSSNFWPPIQHEPLNLPEPVDQLLSDYAKRFNKIKAPSKLQWKKSLGTIKLELQFQDREMQFTVAPVHASVILKFQDQPRSLKFRSEVETWLQARKNGANTGAQELLGGEEEEERSVASVENQLHKEMTIYEVH